MGIPLHHGADVGDLGEALGWRTVVAAYESLVFDVARPRTLVSPEHVARVAAHVQALPSKFESFRVSEYGLGSAIALTMVLVMLVVSFFYVRQMVREGEAE